MLFSDDGTMKGRRIFQSIHAVLPTATTCATIDGDRVYSIEGYCANERYAGVMITRVDIVVALYPDFRRDDTVEI